MQNLRALGYNKILARPELNVRIRHIVVCIRLIDKGQKTACAWGFTITLLHSRAMWRLLKLSSPHTNTPQTTYKGVLQLWFLPTRIPREGWMLFVEVDKWFILIGWEIRCWLRCFHCYCVCLLCCYWNGSYFSSPNTCRSWKLYSKIPRTPFCTFNIDVTAIYIYIFVYLETQIAERVDK